MKVPSRAGIAPPGRDDPDRDLARPCPICQARPNWRCTKTVGYQVLPRKKVHPERKR